jgi:4-diphosphocytidyl-2-C-methyl-D-erythritol kinase
MTAILVERAPVKVNLALRVGARRDDGLHEIESLVAFAQVADGLSLEAGRALGLDVRGSSRKACGPLADNLVMKAVRALAERVEQLQLGHFTLVKRIPVAGGLGGGSADAAAALRLLARANDLELSDYRLFEAASATGADVPVCLDPKPRLMHGIGEVLSEPLQLPKVAAVLVNPGVALATKDVFAAFDRYRPTARALSVGMQTNIPRERAALLAYLAGQSNDLEAAAISLAPVISEVLGALRALPECRLARMSGSGATCFALCDSSTAATTIAQAMRAAHPGWWVRATALGGELRQP